VPEPLSSPAHLDDSARYGLDELADWREHLRQWLALHVPASWRVRLADGTSAGYVDFQHRWRTELRAGGLLAPHWPKAAGGAGLGLAEQMILAEELAWADAPRLTLFYVSLYHAAGTILAMGTPDQQRKYLPGILDGDVWCQGFSETEAGSDLAGLQTRARRDGDSYVVSGHKIWSTGADLARYCLLLARTDVDAPRHAALSYLILDLSSPGVEVRPIRQINGDHEFSQIFFDDVRVSCGDLIGAEGQGWKVALSTLSIERSVTFVDLCERLRISCRWLARDLASQLAAGRARSEAGALCQELASLHARLESLRLICHQMLEGSLTSRGEHGPKGATAGVAESYGPMIKLCYSDLLQRLSDLGVRIVGLDANIERPLNRTAAGETRAWLPDYLTSFGWTISGGANEIMCNIIAERTLGLPRNTTGS
jgi:alkylation response protein AidB-like acyl-CoA dehydrogenase